MKNYLAVVISEVNTVKYDLALHFLVVNSAVSLMTMLPSPYACTLFALFKLTVQVIFCINELNIALVCFRLLVEEVKHSACARGSLNNECHLLAYLCDRLCEVLVKGYKCYDSAEGKTCIAVYGKDSSHNGTKHIAEVSDICVYRHHDVSVLVSFVCTDSQLVIYLYKVFYCLILVTEHFYYLLSVKHFFDKAVNCAKVTLLSRKVRS